MPAKPRQRFAAQVDAELLEVVRDLARKEGRQVQALVDAALTDLVEKRRGAKPRSHVMESYRASLPRYAGLYKKLAE